MKILFNAVPAELSKIINIFSNIDIKNQTPVDNVLVLCKFILQDIMFINKHITIFDFIHYENKFKSLWCDDSHLSNIYNKKLLSLPLFIDMDNIYFIKIEYYVYIIIDINNTLYCFVLDNSDPTTKDYIQPLTVFIIHENNL